MEKFDKSDVDISESMLSKKIYRSDLKKRK